jgi:prolyl-tRNA editing enzyme YbaK/EbsC (Cys-tRNA(Pro) deacylase)
MPDPREAEAGVLATLDHLGAAYQRVEIDPAFADTAAFCQRYGYPPEKAANTIVVASRKEPPRYAACVVLATMRLDVNHAVRRLMGVPRLSFADHEETVRLTGMQVGGVTPFNLPAGLPLYVDEAVMGCDYIIVGGGGRSSKLKLAPDVLRRLPGVRVVAGLARPRP